VSASVFDEWVLKVDQTMGNADMLITGL